MEKEIPPISWNQYKEEFGGTYEEFSIRSLAYLLQQRKDMDQRTRGEFEKQLEGRDLLSGKLNCPWNKI